VVEEEKENIECLVVGLPTATAGIRAGAQGELAYYLSRGMFRDRLNLWHGAELRGIPSVYDGCGAAFSLEHALNCVKGGNMEQGHDQMKCPPVHAGLCGRGEEGAVLDEVC